MNEIKEGSLYKSIKIGDHTFDIYYGYYSDSERSLWEPTPIFPDFTKNLTYNSRGEPYTGAYQDICEHYSPRPEVSGENWCNDCEHFLLCEEIIGICKCRERNQNFAKPNDIEFQKEVILK